MVEDVATASALPEPSPIIITLTLHNIFLILLAYIFSVFLLITYPILLLFAPTYEARRNCILFSKCQPYQAHVHTGVHVCKRKKPEKLLQKFPLVLIFKLLYLKNDCRSVRFHWSSVYAC